MKRRSQELYREFGEVVEPKSGNEFELLSESCL